MPSNAHIDRTKEVCSTLNLGHQRAHRHGNTLHFKVSSDAVERHQEYEFGVDKPRQKLTGGLRALVGCGQGACCRALTTGATPHRQTLHFTLAGMLGNHVKFGLEDLVYDIEFSATTRTGFGAQRVFLGFEILRNFLPTCGPGLLLFFGFDRLFRRFWAVLKGDLFRAFQDGCWLSGFRLRLFALVLFGDDQQLIKTLLKPCIANDECIIGPTRIGKLCSQIFDDLVTFADFGLAYLELHARKMITNTTPCRSLFLRFLPPPFARFGEIEPGQQGRKSRCVQTDLCGIRWNLWQLKRTSLKPLAQ